MSDEAMSNFTPRAQQVLALARKEADRFNHNFVGTEHLLIGILRVESSTAARILTAKGLNVYGVREETISILRGLKEKYEVHHGVRITTIVQWA